MPIRPFARHVLALAACGSLWGGSALAAAPLWQDAAAAPSADARQVQARQARWVEVDVAALGALVRQLPAASSRQAQRPTLALPLPDGSSLTLHLHETAVMAPALAARYPQIRTFAGTVPGRPEISARLDLSPRGLRAQIFTPQGRVFIDPAVGDNTRLHQVSYAQDQSPRSRTADRVLKVPGAASAALRAAAPAIGDQLLTYRVAIATTGEYARFHDAAASPSNKVNVLAELVTLTNRVTGVYEREVGIQLQLVEGTDEVIYTDPATDPYTNDDGGKMLGQNIRTLKSVLGNGSFDIGHVVSTGGGGVAYLGVVCDKRFKAGGVTGLGAPVNDAFYIDYVAHEMGHQFGANHTFNSQSGACAGNREPSVAYEPGSGSTIMAYAGICDADDLQPHSDAQFHSASFDEIVRYTRSGGGAACAVVTPTGNRAPSVTVPSGGFTIPAQTPFELTGQASDPDGDTLSYQWEQRDLGAAGSPNQPDASAPLFRSFPPTASATRSFPQLSDLLGNMQTLGEILPSVSRALNFRLTVRDDLAAPSAGGVASADLSFKVSAAAGPFKLTSPNTAGSFRPGSSLRVTWDVANTTAAPVSCAAVDVWFSADGGQTFVKRLKKSAPNSGSTTVKLPAQTVQTARLKVKCSSNIFFDVSDANFKVE